MQDNIRFLSPKDVCELTSVSRTTLWELVRDGDFPKPIRISKTRNRVAYAEHEVQAWLASKIAERDGEAA